MGFLLTWLFSLVKPLSVVWETDKKVQNLEIFYLNSRDSFQYYSAFHQNNTNILWLLKLNSPKQQIYCKLKPNIMKTNLPPATFYWHKIKLSIILAKCSRIDPGKWCNLNISCTSTYVYTVLTLFLPNQVKISLHIF